LYFIEVLVVIIVVVTVRTNSLVSFILICRTAGSAPLFHGNTGFVEVLRNIGSIPLENTLIALFIITAAYIIVFI